MPWDWEIPRNSQHAVSCHGTGRYLATLSIQCHAMGLGDTLQRSACMQCHTMGLGDTLQHSACSAIPWDWEIPCNTQYAVPYANGRHLATLSMQCHAMGSRLPSLSKGGWGQLELSSIAVMLKGGSFSLCSAFPRHDTAC